MSQKAHIQRAVDLVGGVRALATATGVQVQVVYQWLAGDRPVPAERAPLIEQATDGRVTAEDVCPKVPWEIIRNPPPTTKAA